MYTMKRIVYTPVLLILNLIALSACNKWFDVTPVSEVRDEQHFKTVKGFRQSLTGCYIALSEYDLYGRDLSWFLPEMMAHQYRDPVTETDRAIFNHNYRKKTVFNRVEGIWNKLYNVIVNANDALIKLEERKSILTPMEYAIIKGEFLAIRAYVHLDLLRYFGYGGYSIRVEELSKKPSIPYVTGLSKEPVKQFTGAELYNALMKDLDEAATLLKEYDPIVSDGHNDELKEINVEGYYNNRSLKLNYYAVRALQARVAMWFGTPEAMDKAFEAASEVVAASEANTLVKNPNIKTVVRLQQAYEISINNCSFTTEALFALDVPKLDDYTQQYFKINPDNWDSSALVFTPERIKQLFSGNEADVRLSKVLIKNSALTYTSLKYASRDQINNRINMIRLPEVYFILADARLHKKDKKGAIDLLNTIRRLRGISDNIDEQTEEEEVRKLIFGEYEREFTCEGVLFFQQKRLALEVIPQLSEGQKMGDTQYLLPFPDLENSYGRIQ